MPGVIKMQDVSTTDPLRKRLFHLQDIGAASVETINLHTVTVGGLPDTGGTIVGAFGFAATAPTGSSTFLTMDVHRQRAGTSQTIFATKLLWATATNKATAPVLSATSADLKVYNGDQLQLQCDAVGDTVAGSDVSVCVEVRVDCAND